MIGISSGFIAFLILTVAVILLSMLRNQVAAPYIFFTGFVMVGALPFYAYLVAKFGITERPIVLLSKVWYQSLILGAIFMIGGAAGVIARIINALSVYF